MDQTERGLSALSLSFEVLSFFTYSFVLYIISREEESKGACHSPRKTKTESLVRAKAVVKTKRTIGISQDTITTTLVVG